MNETRLKAGGTNMDHALHITSGDIAGGHLQKAGLEGEVFVWHDILYDGPRIPGWPDESTLLARAAFLESATGGGLTRQIVLKTLRHQYDKLASFPPDQHIVLWFDACLFDQSMLAHIITCLEHQKRHNAEIICIDSFPGIEPFHGLGQMQPRQLASCYPARQPVTDAQFRFAGIVDKAFADQDDAAFSELALMPDAPLPWIPAAVARWLAEKPDPQTGLGRLEQLALDAIRAGCSTPADIFASVSAAEEPPQFWGDTMLWEKINRLAEHRPPLVHIKGPVDRLPQWQSDVSLSDFTITEG
jgi:hypothetical protein